MLDLTLSSTVKSANSKASSNPRSTAKTSWNNALTISNANLTDCAPTTILLNTVTVATLQSQPPERITMTDVNYVKVHIVWMLVPSSLVRSLMMSIQLESRALLASFVRIARCVLLSDDQVMGQELMKQSTEHDTVDCPLAEDVF